MNYARDESRKTNTKSKKKKFRPFPIKNIDKKYHSRKKNKKKKQLQAEKSNIQSGAAE